MTDAEGSPNVGRMHAQRDALVVGLVPQGGAGWIAGVVYLENIVRAVAALNSSPVELCYIASCDHPLAYRSAGTLGVAEYFYTHRSRDSWIRVARHCVRSRRFPQSFEVLSSRIGLSVLFPLQTPPSEPSPVPWVGWIPDFQHKRRPEFFSVAERAQRDLSFQRLVDEARHIVVSSLDARADLMRWFPTPEARVSVLQFRTVLDRHWFEMSTRAVVDQFNLPRKYLVYPSQFWIHKNHGTVLAALSLLRDRGKTDIVLVSTGREYDYRWPEYGEELKNEITRLGLGSQVRCLGLLDRPTQIQVMRASAAVVQASVFEGWSALVEDSRALGKRIFVSDIPVHREQEPHDPVYFHPERAEELANAIERHWPNLEPGPDLAREAHARDQQEGLTRDFARRFVDIVERAGRTP